MTNNTTTNLKVNAKRSSIIIFFRYFSKCSQQETKLIKAFESLFLFQTIDFREVRTVVLGA